MSMLNRYRRSGGFQQLINLIETCDPAKKEKLMQLIGEEDPGWAVLLQMKTLTLERIMSWDLEVIMEFSGGLPDRVLAVALHCVDEQTAEKVLKGLPLLRARDIQSLFSEIKPSSGEKHAASIKVIQAVRDMEKEGLLKLTTIDPRLEIEEALIA